MHQQITIAGHLGRDPEYRYTPAGTAVANMNVATSRSWTGQDGKRQERTLWFRVAAWGKLADVCNQYLTKGSKVLVVGEMEEPNIWTDRDGNARANLQIRASTVRFLSSKSEQKQTESEESYGMDDDDGHVPF